MQVPINQSLSSPSNYRILIVEDEYIIANDLALLLSGAGYAVTGVADSVAEAKALMEVHAPDIVLLDIYLRGAETGIDLAKQLEENNIPFIYISANDNKSVLEAVKATQPSGYIVKPFRERDLLTTLEISRYRHAHSVELKLREEKMLQIALTDALSNQETWEQRLLTTATLLQAHIPFDFLGIHYRKEEKNQYFNFYRVGYEEYQTLNLSDIEQLNGITVESLSYSVEDSLSTGPVRFQQDAFKTICHRNPYLQLLANTFRLESGIVMKLNIGKGRMFVIYFLSRKAETYLSGHIRLLERLEQPLTLMLERVLAFEEVARLSEQLRQENTYLQEEVKTTANFEEIIGQSKSLLEVFDQVTQVAHTNATVLILGESGTGKELIARAIHNLSPRKDKILVKINCAALPATLIESELFGHEKGAFTGAFEKRIGKFELANGGTIFLDEIGEMPLDLQAKLLRVLQEKEIERLGGNTPINIDVRIIVATNRHLEKEVAENRFRMDLYFRLSTFPITVPPLRERLDDIPLLAQFFARKSARKLGKPFRGIQDTTLQKLMDYPWPGNIRELENVIEQAVILHDGQTPLVVGRSLTPLLFSSQLVGAVYAPANSKSHSPTAAVPKDLQDIKQIQQETEREYILAILQQTKGRIRGSGGAAELLDLKPTTLEYRMEKLGIRKVISVQPAKPSPNTD